MGLERVRQAVHVVPRRSRRFESIPVPKSSRRLPAKAARFTKLKLVYHLQKEARSFQGQNSGSNPDGHATLRVNNFAIGASGLETTTFHYRGLEGEAGTSVCQCQMPAMIEAALVGLSFPPISDAEETNQPESCKDHCSRLRNRSRGSEHESRVTLRFRVGTQPARRIVGVRRHIIRTSAAAQTARRVVGIRGNRAVLIFHLC